MVKILSKIVNFLFPQICFTCKSSLSSDEILFCKTCFKKLPFVKSYCKRCGRLFSIDFSEVFEEDTLSYCGNCLKDPPPFERVFLGFHYREPISSLIQRAKFSENFELAYQLGRLLRKAIEVSFEFYDYILPVPLSKKRKRERGYNQSQLMLWGYGGFYLPKELLIRARHTRPQSELSLKERLENLKGAFAVRSSVKEKKILLFDDVMTSGATLYETAKVFKKAGAKEVHLLVLARA
ncbi:MAG: ComF family protein [Caldimicrobium sp.]